jgi:hypothetical protein
LGAFTALTSADVEEYGYQDQTFAQNPKDVLNGALRHVQSDQQTRDEYDNVLLPLIYGAGRPAFAQAWGSFGGVAERMIANL